MEQVMNGVQKPADVIARGSHVYDEPTHKYKEQPTVYKPFPRAMWKADGGYTEALNEQNQESLEAQGWQTKPFPPKPAQESPNAAGADLALIVLQQRTQMDAMQALMEQQSKQIAALMENVTAPVAIPESDIPRRGPGRPPNPTKAE